MVVDMVGVRFKFCNTGRTSIDRIDCRTFFIKQRTIRIDRHGLEMFRDILMNGWNQLTGVLATSECQTKFPPRENFLRVLSGGSRPSPDDNCTEKRSQRQLCSQVVKVDGRILVRVGFATAFAMTRVSRMWNIVQTPDKQHQHWSKSL